MSLACLSSIYDLIRKKNSCRPTNEINVSLSSIDHLNLGSGFECKLISEGTRKLGICDDEGDGDDEQRCDSDEGRTSMCGTLRGMIDNKRDFS